MLQLAYQQVRQAGYYVVNIDCIVFAQRPKLATHREAICGRLADILDLEWIYLGYWVEGCKAFAYKPKFQPQELLDGFPGMDDEPDWRLVDLLKSKNENG